ncbi:MAG: helicase HerA-like domain-containing protein [Candidatus Faecousia sp.]|nr:helicase HerA-like domain-containing protein [Candidatus Faecousia sp.]
MLNEDGKLLIGVGETPVCLLPRMANRHGLISGATGTGKTITLKVMAESFSALGVPVFLADVKGDLAGCCRTGERTEAIDRRLTAMGLDPETFRYQPFPVRFWDVYGEMGHPVRTTVSEMGAPLLSRLLDLTAVQEGVLTIVFRVADEKGWLLSDLKDLRAMVNYVAEHADEYRSEYGNVSKQSAGAIQRSLLQLEDAGGDLFFGEPDIELSDWFQTDDKGKGYINILHCERLYRSPLLYATFLLWLLAELFEQLPEVGDPEKPKLVFFFDEAHLLFDDAPKALVDKVEQVVRLIRSKGVGVFFITQRPSDVPDSVLAQLGNKVQHALRAYTPAEQKAVRAAAQGFRANPAFDTQDAIMDLGTGEALVSFLDEKGRPSVVERVTILPPQSLMGPIDERRRSAELSYDELYGKYETPVDPESAYEIITADRAAAAKAEAEAQAAKEREKLEQQKEKEKKATSKRRTSAGRKVANSALNAVGREVGRSFTRGLLGTLKKWF